MSDAAIARAGRRAFIFTLAAFALALCALSQSPRAKADTAHVARGRYLSGPAGLPRQWSREPAALPMSRYCFSHDDREAIAAYLASAGSAR
jgi:hypothetical protein